MFYIAFLRLKNFKFCSVGPSEHPMGTDGTSVL